MAEKNLYDDPVELAAVLAPLRRERGALVLANGCFDVLHVGHVRYLREAASLGGILVVALNDDASTRALKGPGRPVVAGSDRAAILLALRFVDYVLLFGEATVDRVLRVLRPDIHAKGTDYAPETVPERETAREIGCRTVITGDPKARSSREIIGRIREGEGRGL